MLSQEYRISDIDQLIAQYRCKIEIGIFCASQDTEQMNKKLALPIHENPKPALGSSSRNEIPNNSFIISFIDMIFALFFSIWSGIVISLSRSMNISPLETLSPGSLLQRSSCQELASCLTYAMHSSNFSLMAYKPSQTIILNHMVLLNRPSISNIRLLHLPTYFHTIYSFQHLANL